MRVDEGFVAAASHCSFKKYTARASFALLGGGRRMLHRARLLNLLYLGAGGEWGRASDTKTADEGAAAAKLRTEAEA